MIDEIIEKAQVWCESNGKRLSDGMTDEDGKYFLELNDGEKDYKVLFPEEFQKVDLSKFVN
jgi:hypothetical protein